MPVTATAFVDQLLSFIDQLVKDLQAAKERKTGDSM